MIFSYYAVLAIPILLVHGYAESSSVWDYCLSWLKASHFNMTEVKAITFHNDDQCGSVQEHATELTNIVDRILNETHSSSVDMVVHSKGGLDARWYIAHNPKDKVANLIMLGTPNKGSVASYVDLTPCAFSSSSGRQDLQPGSDATRTVDRIQQTHYYTISGNYAVPCYLLFDYTLGSNATCSAFPSDGVVSISSAQSNYTKLGIYPYNHAGLLVHKDIYEKILPILLQHP